MSIQSHYLQLASQLITAYDGKVPLHIYLKQFFTRHKKYGSRDRKSISGLCYNYFRLGKGLVGLPVENKVILAQFLLSTEPGNLLAELNPIYNDHAGVSIGEKLMLAGLKLGSGSIFPFGKLLSAGIDPDVFERSFLKQPDVFVRTRPGRNEAVENKISQLELGWVKEASTAFRLVSGIQVDKYFTINKDFVIQDLHSQAIGAIVKNTFEKNAFFPKQLWDCCAASGGKSIMMQDLFPGLTITASDIRQSILRNLEKRFREAGISKYKSFVVDVSANKIDLSIGPFQFILADVPCTGSGTWARTPEQLYYFREEALDDYARKQFAIANNALKYLLPGGWFVYITCSVFKKENESIIEKLLVDNPVELIHQQILNGSGLKCDSMFVAILRKH